MFGENKGNGDGKTEETYLFNAKQIVSISFNRANETYSTDLVIFIR